MEARIIRAAAARLPELGGREPFAVYRLAVTAEDMLTATHRDTTEVLGWSGPATGWVALGREYDPDAELRAWWANVCRLFARFTGHELEAPPLDQLARDQHAADRSAWTYARELSGTGPTFTC